MYHFVLLLPHLGVVVGATDEYEVSRLHLLLGRQSDGQTIELIGLIPAVKLEAEFFSEIIDDLPNKGAAVKIKWCLIVLLSLFPIAPRIWNTEILLGSLYKLFPQSLFEIGVFLVRERLLADVVSVLDVLFLGISESLEMSL